MDRRGQTALSIAFYLLVFLIIYSLAWANVVSEWGSRYVYVNNVTGLEAFFYMNLNFVIITGMLMSMAYMAWLGSSG